MLLKSRPGCSRYGAERNWCGHGSLRSEKVTKRAVLHIRRSSRLSGIMQTTQRSNLAPVRQGTAASSTWSGSEFQAAVTDTSITSASLEHTYQPRPIPKPVLSSTQRIWTSCHRQSRSACTCGYAHQKMRKAPPAPYCPIIIGLRQARQHIYAEVLLGKQKQPEALI